MRNFTLLLIFVLGAISAFSQQHLERQEVSALGVQYQAQSIHHLRDYQLRAPALQIRQDVQWKDMLIQVGSSHIPDEFSILRGAHFGISYRPIDPYRVQWWEAGIGFSYDKQDPSLSQTGKLTGWTVTLAAYRPVNDWYSHTGRLTAGLFQGYVVDPKGAAFEEYLRDDLTKYQLDHVRMDLSYSGQITLIPFDLKFEAGHRRSRYSRESLLTLQAVKSVVLSAGQRLDVWAGLTATAFRQQKSVLQDVSYAEVPPRVLYDWSRTNGDISPIVWQVGARMVFLRGKKQRAF